MIHGCVTLDEVFAAASARAASLVPETSGYLALAVGDATSRLPFAIEDRNVMLTTEGNVGITKRGEVLPPRQAAAGMREVLGRLLSVSMGTAMPALAHAGKPREESDRGVDAVVEEIEAALIPVNRAAARRALARLARETIKAKETGRIKPRSSVRPPPAPKPEAAQAEAPKVEAAKVEPPKVEPAKVEPPKVEPRPEPARVATPRPAKVATPKPAPVVAEAPTVVAHAMTPPPLEAAPILAAPRDLTPPPARLEIPPPADLSPLPVDVEPTPTVLGMAEVDLDPALPEPELHAEPLEAAPPTPRPAATPSSEIVTVALAVGPRASAPAVTPSEEVATVAIAVAPRPEPTASADVAPAADEVTQAAPLTVPELAAPATESPADAAVMAQPSEPAEVAFGLTPRPRPVAEPITPPFALEAEPAPRVLPAAIARPTAAEPRHGALDVAASPRAVAVAHTRADELLARFGASCEGDRGVTEAAACLRRMAGVDPTPAPARVEIRVKRVEPDPGIELAQIPQDAETPIVPRVRARQARQGSSFALTLAVLLVGIAGGGALVRFRPDLFGGAQSSDARPRKEAPEAPAPRKEAPVATPTSEPQGAVAPSWTPGVGTRAQR